MNTSNAACCEYPYPRLFNMVAGKGISSHQGTGWIHIEKATEPNEDRRHNKKKSLRQSNHIPQNALLGTSVLIGIIGNSMRTLFPPFPLSENAPRKEGRTHQAGNVHSA